VSVLHPLSPQPFPKEALVARLSVAAFALILAFVGSMFSPLMLLGLLALALVGLMVFEVGWVGGSGDEPRLALPERRRRES